MVGAFEAFFVHVSRREVEPPVRALRLDQSKSAACVAKQNQVFAHESYRDGLLILDR
jgi:hypothetical protein